MTRGARILHRAASTAATSALLPKGAQAQLVETGLGPVHDGVAHFALSPEDYVPIVGLALLAGLRGKDQARLAVLLMPLAWVIGGVLGSLPDAPALAAPSWTAFLVVGGLVAADLRLPIAVTGALIVGLTIVLNHRLIRA